VEPLVVSEFEDGALAKIVASEGIGITIVPTAVAAEAVERYGFVGVGQTKACSLQLHLITAECRIEHPGVALLAREIGGRASRRSRSAG